MGGKIRNEPQARDSMARKERKFLGRAIFISIIALLVVRCQRGEPRWQGTIEEVDGVILVKNPKKPAREEPILALREELSIGQKEGPPEYLFSQIQDLDVDEEGHVYALDQRETHVKVFDGQGVFLRTIGRKGQGPGEVELPVFVQITARGELLVYDYALARAVFYTRDGVFLRQQSTRRPFMPIALNSRGFLVGMEVLAPPPIGGKILKIYGPDFHQVTVVAQDDQGQERVFDIGRPTIFACVGPNDEIIWGNSETYALNVVNSAGETIKLIRREYDPVPITATDKKKFEEESAEAVRHGMSLRFRAHFPAFGGIFVDEEGRIFVRTHEADGGGFMFDVFDPEGRYQTRAIIKANLNERSAWKKGRLYTIETDDLGYPSIVRYQVNWKD